MIDLRKIKDLGEGKFLGLEAAGFNVHYAIITPKGIDDLGVVQVPKCNPETGEKYGDGRRGVSVFSHLMALMGGPNNSRGILGICLGDKSEMLIYVASIVAALHKVDSLVVSDSQLCESFGSKHRSQLVNKIKTTSGSPDKPLPDGSAVALARALALFRLKGRVVRDEVRTESGLIVAGA